MHPCNGYICRLSTCLSEGNSHGWLWPEDRVKMSLHSPVSNADAGSWLFNSLYCLAPWQVFFPFCFTVPYLRSLSGEPWLLSQGNQKKTADWKWDISRFRSCPCTEQAGAVSSLGIGIVCPPSGLLARSMWIQGKCLASSECKTSQWERGSLTITVSVLAPGRLEYLASPRVSSLSE